MILYLQIFGPMRWMRACCYFGLFFMTGFYIPFWIVQMYDTTPAPGETWQQNFADPRFARTVTLSLPLGCVSLVSDVYIYVLPILGVSQLQMSRRRKFEVALVFMTGLVYDLYLSSNKPLS